MPHRFLPESGHSSGFRWNLEEFKMAERPAKITIPGVTYSGGNKAIPELRPECSPESTGTECDRNTLSGIIRLAKHVSDGHVACAAGVVMTGPPS